MSKDTILDFKERAAIFRLWAKAKQQKKQTKKRKLFFIFNTSSYLSYLNANERRWKI